MMKAGLKSYTILYKQINFNLYNMMKEGLKTYTVLYKQIDINLCLK